MLKITKLLKSTYIFIILAIFYVPLLFAAVFSFNADPKKGDMSFKSFESFSSAGWQEVFNGGVREALLNSLLLALPVAFIVIAISLLTVYALWKQKRKVYKTIVDGTSNIPLINPDIITAISLMLVFGLLFGSIQFGDTGYFRVVIAHVVMVLPFGLTIMYPRSEKFSLSLLEASKDLGFGPVRTWFKTYFIHMLPVIVGTFAISMVLSLDDFILGRLIYKSDTIGSRLYSGSVRAWSLAVGTLMMLVVIFGATIFALFRMKNLKGNRRKI